MVYNQRVTEVVKCLSRARQVVSRHIMGYGDAISATTIAVPKTQG